MEFRRSGGRDERRRRVLTENVGAREPHESQALASGVESRRVPVSEPANLYTDAARPARQPHVVDIIPRRFSTVVVLVGLTLSCVAGLEALYGHFALDATGMDVAQLPAINLAEPGNLGSWFSAALLCGSAVLGALIYLIRRHRLDDYRGRYRMWFWAVLVLILASVDQVANLQVTIRTSLLYLGRIPGFADAMSIWTAALALIVGAMGLRLGLEVRYCRLAIVALAVSLASYAGVAAMNLGWILPDESVFREMMLSGLTMGGHVALFSVLCLYARHVQREAIGLPADGRRKKHRRRRKAAVAASSAPASAPRRASTRARKTRVDGAHQKTLTSRRAPSVEKPRQTASAAVPAPAATGAKSPLEGNRAKVAAQRAEGTSASGRSGGPLTVGKKNRPAAVSQDNAAPAAVATRQPATDASDGASEDRRLSKAERRRLRKLRRRDRQPQE